MTDALPDTCWAFSPTGDRCEQIAGHEGDHAIINTWTDAECYKPKAPPARAVAPAPSEPAEKPVTKCIACGHSHKTGPCRCGCHTQIG